MVAVASCTFPVLVFVAYRQARIEREIVAELLSKSPGGSAEVDSIPTWRNRLYDLLGIPRPVTWLDLRGPQIDDHDLARLESLRSLQTLCIDQCPITDEGIKEVAKVTSLTGVVLFGCDGITDTSLTYLGTMRSLSALHVLTFAKISGRNLSAFSNLEILDLNGCLEMSDDAVRPLSSLSHLSNLDIRGTSIGEEGAKHVVRALPNTIVLTDFPLE